MSAATIRALVFAVSVLFWLRGTEAGATTSGHERQAGPSQEPSAHKPADKQKKSETSQTVERSSPANGVAGTGMQQAPTPKGTAAQSTDDAKNRQIDLGQKDQTWRYVRVIAVAEGHDSLDVAVAPFNDCKLSRDQGPSIGCQQLHLLAKDNVVKDRIKDLQQGDRITVTFTRGDGDKNELKQFCFDKAPPVPPITRFWVLVGCSLICFAFICLGTKFAPLNLILGEDNRYSNSKFQIATWFFVLLSTYLATVVLRIWYGKCDFIGGVDIPQNILLLSGMSVLSFAGAKGITSSKAENAKKTENVSQKTTAAAPSLWDLVQNDANQFDLGDFQMLVITLLATSMYVILVFSFLSSLELRSSVQLPNVDTTILATFGLGQGAYLAKKAAGNVGNS